MAPNHGRILQGHFDGKTLLIWQSKLYNFNDANKRPLDAFLYALMSTPKRATEKIPRTVDPYVHEDDLFMEDETDGRLSIRDVLESLADRLLLGPEPSSEYSHSAAYEEGDIVRCHHFENVLEPFPRPWL